ncbi:putative C2H2-type domain-containing protein [Seiridium cardinale]|uniref:C2H2-type domain-containing protein n=1 Tax=Seiridium cardinale TaxID=138064 RepID=A0ABR2YA84_9PEZI
MPTLALVAHPSSRLEISQLAHIPLAAGCDPSCTLAHMLQRDALGNPVSPSTIHRVHQSTAAMSLQGSADKGELNPVPRHVCHCGKSFIRKEHLTRHQATHNEPAYICDKCQRQFSRKLQRSSTQDGSQTVQISSSQDEETGSGSGATTAPNDATAEAPRIAGTGALSAHLEFFRNLAIAATERTPGEDFQPTGVGMEAIYETLIAGYPSLSEVLRKLPNLRAWVTESSAAYLRTFHTRWPVLHAMSLDIENDPLPLTATICMIGTWIQSPTISVDRFYALRVHEFLLQRFLQDMIDPESMSKEKEWPVDFLRAVVLTLMFSFYRTGEAVLSKTMLLRSLFATYTKQLGLFSSAALMAHQQKHHPGTYPLWLMQTRERYTKVAAVVFQLDAYLALAYRQSPMLHRQEVDVELNATFGLWNAVGIDVCLKRLADEPAGRRTSTVSEMTKGPDSFKGSPLLIEDVQLGLCGLLQVVWVLAEFYPSKSLGYVNTAFQRLLLNDKLDSWKTELDRISDSVNLDNIATGAAKYLLLAYRGDNDSAIASLERITTLVQDSMVLYYLLKLYTCCGLQLITKEGLHHQAETITAQSRILTTSEREALLYALEMLKTTEGFVPTASCLNPLIRHALMAGANLTKELVTEQICECHGQEGQTATTSDLQGQIDTDGPVVFDGIPVCVCNLEIWTARFEKALEIQNTMME